MSARKPAAVEPEHPRLLSLDAYRGLIMISLAFVGFGMADVARNHLEADPVSEGWQTVLYHFTHCEWVGCSYWDMIQPSFMFMVGVSMAFSYSKRAGLGHSQLRMFGHAAWRAVILILLGVFLSSGTRGHTNWSFMNVLSQIGLGYAFLFLLWRKSLKTQTITAAALLMGTWILYLTWPDSGMDLDTGAPKAGVTAEWAQENLEGVGRSWHKNANAGHAIDKELLNWFPREEPFEFNNGGYQTINFIPSLATMLFGLMCGELLRSGRTARRKLLTLLIAGGAGLIAGLLLHWVGFSPIVKRIWTPSWAIFSTGWCCLILLFLYAIIDVAGWKRWAFPLVVVGMNSIVMYLLSQLLKPWTFRVLKTHAGNEPFTKLGEMWQPFLEKSLVGLAFWLFLWWLYRQRIFVRI